MPQVTATTNARNFIGLRPRRRAASQGAARFIAPPWKAAAQQILSVRPEFLAPGARLCKPQHSATPDSVKKSLTPFSKQSSCGSQTRAPNQHRHARRSPRSVRHAGLVLLPMTCWPRCHMSWVNVIQALSASPSLGLGAIHLAVWCRWREGDLVQIKSGDW